MERRRERVREDLRFARTKLRKHDKDREEGNEGGLCVRETAARSVAAIKARRLYSLAMVRQHGILSNFVTENS